VVAAAAVAVAAPGDAVRAERAVRRGMAALRRGDLTAARARFREAVRLDPGLPEAHDGLGRVAMRRRAWREALGHLERARELYRARELERARREAEEAMEAERARQGLRDFVSGELSESGCWTEQTYRLVIPGAARLDREGSAPPPEEVDDPPGLMFRIGVCRLHLGDLRGAREAFLRELAVAPANGAAHLDLAVCELRLGRPDRALTELDLAVRSGIREPPGLRDEIEAALGRR